MKAQILLITSSQVDSSYSYSSASDHARLARSDSYAILKRVDSTDNRFPFLPWQIQEITILDKTKFGINPMIAYKLTLELEDTDIERHIFKAAVNDYIDTLKSNEHVRRNNFEVRATKYDLADLL